MFVYKSAETDSLVSVDMFADHPTDTKDNMTSAKQELLQFGKMPKSTDEPKDLSEKVHTWEAPQKKKNPWELQKQVFN